MTAQEYIAHQLDNLKSASVSSEAVSNIEDLIFKMVMSKKFRKYSVTPEYQERMKGAIHNSVSKNEPIRFSFPFGGYKLWRLDETPEVDWAELFTLVYYANWLKPITTVFEPGIVFDFASDDVIVERMNNVPKADTEAYAKSFKQIAGFIKTHLPENFNITFTPISSFYTPEEFETDLEDKIEAMEKQLGGLPVLDERKKNRVEMNVRLKPGQADDPQWREKTELMHQAYYTVSKRRPYNRAKEKILVFPTKMGDCIAVGTTKTSVAKFWVGVGALEKRDESFIETILSPTQLEKAHFDWEPVNIKALEGKNFKKVRVLK